MPLIVPPISIMPCMSHNIQTQVTKLKWEFLFNMKMQVTTTYNNKYQKVQFATCLQKNPVYCTKLKDPLFSGSFRGPSRWVPHYHFHSIQHCLHCAASPSPSESTIGMSVKTTCEGPTAEGVGIGGLWPSCWCSKKNTYQAKVKDTKELTFRLPAEATKMWCLKFTGYLTWKLKEWEGVHQEKLKIKCFR